MEKINEKEKYLKTLSVPILAILIGYSFLFLITYLFHTDISITGLAISNQTISEQSASLALGDSRQIIEEMKKYGFNVVRANDLLEEARAQMALKNYERVISISNEIENLKQMAFKIQNKINNATLKIAQTKKSGFNTTEAEVLLNLGIAEFSLENYEGSEEYLSKSIEKLDTVTEEEITDLIKNLYALKNVSLENKLNITRLENIINEAQNALETSDTKRINILKKELLNLNKSLNILILAKNEINSMADAGLATARVNSILAEAEFALELGYYDKIEDITKDIMAFKLKAIELQEGIQKTKAEIDKAKGYGLSLNEAELLFNSSQNEFKLENYEDAEKLLKQSFEKTERLIADSLLFGTISKSELRFNVINFLKRAWWLVLIIIVITSILGVVAVYGASIAILQVRLKSLEREKEALTSLIKKAQIAYFKENTMDKPTYNLAIDKYQNRIIDIREKIPLVKAKLIRKKEKVWKFWRHPKKDIP